MVKYWICFSLFFYSVQPPPKMRMCGPKRSGGIIGSLRFSRGFFQFSIIETETKTFSSLSRLDQISRRFGHVIHREAGGAPDYPD